MKLSDETYATQKVVYNAYQYGTLYLHHGMQIYATCLCYGIILLHSVCKLLQDDDQYMTDPNDDESEIRISKRRQSHQ